MGLQSFTVKSTDQPLEMALGTNGGLVKAFGATIYYRDEQAVTSSVNDGSIAANASATLYGTQWFMTAAARADVQVVSQVAADAGEDGLPAPITTVTYGDSRFPDQPTIVTEGGVTTVYTYNTDGTFATESRGGVTRTFSYSNGAVTGATVA